MSTTTCLEVTVINTFDWESQQQASLQWRQKAERMPADEYLQRLTETGWLKAIGTEPAAQLRQRLRSTIEDNPAFCFYELAETEFDADCIEETGTDDSCSYYSIVLQLADDSRGLFQPTAVEDSFDREAGQATVAFQHNGQQYRCQVPLDGTWFQQPVLELINQALAEAGTEHRFIVLPSCNQTVSLVLISPEIYTRAVEQHLIPAVSFYAPSPDSQHSASSGPAEQ